MNCKTCNGTGQLYKRRNCPPCDGTGQDLVALKERARSEPHKVSDEVAPRCPQCPGSGLEIGDLGNVVYYRCRGCGWGWGLWKCDAPSVGCEVS